MPNLTSDLSLEERVDRLARILAKGVIRTLEQQHTAPMELQGGQPAAPK